MQLPESAPMAVWPSVVAVAGPGEASETHRHHCLHLILARSGRLDAQTDRVVHTAAGVITAPDVEHAIDATGRQVVLLFVEPESVPGASLTAQLDGPVRLLDSATRDGLCAGLSSCPSSPELDGWARETVVSLTGRTGEVRPRIHPAVARLVRELQERSPEMDTSLEALAGRAGLSPSRLMHAFTESVGIPLRPYLRWLRFQRAAGAIVAGTPLSAAAVEAGFSDAAHMSRSFKRMFGLTPRDLARRS